MTAASGASDDAANSSSDFVSDRASRAASAAYWSAALACTSVAGLSDAGPAEDGSHAWILKLAVEDVSLAIDCAQAVTIDVIRAALIPWALRLDGGPQ